METPSIPLSLPERRAIFAIAVAQGLVLLLLHEGIDAGIGWLMEPMWRIAAYAVVVGAPLAVMLSVDTLPRRHCALLGGGFGTLLLMTGLYFGYQSDGGEHARWAGLTGYAVLAGIGGFVALPLAQVFAEPGARRLPYQRLAFRTWRNALLLLLTAAFCGLVGGILALWATLFELIDVALFSELFSSHRFLYPVTGIVAGLGLTLFSGLARVIAVNRRLLVSVCRELTPFLAFVSVLFLLALAVLGTQTLWNSGIAAVLLLSLTLVQIAFVGVIYDDGFCTPPYPPWLRGFVHLALVLTPIHPLLAMHAIHLRVAQYGWTNDRIYALTAAVVLFLYALGYALSVYRRPEHQWLPWLARVNKIMGVAVVLTCVLLASPVLDPRRISANDQLERLLAGEVPASEFDYTYLRFEGGRPGRAVLERLARLERHPEAASIRLAAARALQLPSRWAHAEAALADELQVRDWIDTGHLEQPVPEAFWEYLRTRANRYPERQCFLDVDRSCMLLAVDLDASGPAELVLLQPECVQPPGVVYRLTADGEWSRAGELATEQACVIAGPNAEQRRGRVAAGDVDTAPARWQRLRVGSETFRLRE